MLYKLLLDSPQAEMYPIKETHGPDVDGVTGSTVNQVPTFMGNVSLIGNVFHLDSNKHPTIEVLTTQTTKSIQQPNDKKKGKNKKRRGGANTSTNEPNNPSPNKKWGN